MNIKIVGRRYELQNGLGLEAYNNRNSITINLDGPQGLIERTKLHDVKITERMTILRKAEELTKQKFSLKHDFIVCECQEINRLTGEKSDITIEPYGDNQVQIVIHKGPCNGDGAILINKICNISFMSYKGIEEELNKIIEELIKVGNKVKELPYYDAVLEQRVYITSDKQYKIRACNDYDELKNKLISNGVYIELIHNNNAINGVLDTGITIYERDKIAQKIKECLSNYTNAKLVNEYSIYIYRCNERYNMSYKVEKIDNTVRIQDEEESQPAKTYNVDYSNYSAIGKCIKTLHEENNKQRKDIQQVLNSNVQQERNRKTKDTLFSTFRIINRVGYRLRKFLRLLDK